MKALWREDAVTQKGEYFTLEDCQSWPKPDKRPFMVCAGTSEKGMRMTGSELDAIFLSGGEPGELAKASTQAKAIAAEYDRYIRTYSMMTVEDWIDGLRWAIATRCGATPTDRWRWAARRRIPCPASCM